jgi:hypothetical protein
MSTEAIFNLRVNTGNSIEDINDFDKSVDNLNKSIQETQTTLESGKGIDAFEKNLDDLDKKLKEGNLSIRQQSKLIREYQSIALQAGESSPIGQRAINSAAELTDRLGDLRNQTTALSSDTVKLDTALQGIETGAAVFQGLQSAIALTGVENEDLVQTMVKLQAVQGVVNAVNVVARNLQKDQILGLQLRIGLEKAKNFILTGSIAGTASLSGAEKELGASTLFSANAMKILRGALIATGIGALIVLIGYLINNFDKVTSVVQKFSGYVLKAYDYFDNLGVAVKVLIGIFFPFIGVVYGAIKALEYFNVIDNKTERDQKARHEANMKRVDKSLAKQAEQRKAKEDAYNAEDKSLGRQIALLEAQGKSSDALVEKRLKNSIKFQKELLKELELNERILKATNAMGVNDELIAETKKSIQETKDAILDAENQLDINKANIDKERLDNAKKANEDRLKAEQDYNKKLTEYFDAIEVERQSKITDAKDKELQALDNKYEELYAKADQAGQSDKELIAKQQLEIAEINEKYAKIESDAVLNQKNEINKLKKEAEEEYLNQLEIISEENRRRLLTAQENEIQDVRDKYFTLEEQAKGNAEQLAILETAKLNEINDINLEYGKEKIANDKAIAEEQKKIDDEKTAQIIKNIERVIEVAQGVQNTFTAFNNLQNVQDNERLKKVKGNTAEEEKIKRAMFEREKKMKLAQVAIDTASAIVKAVSASPTTFGLPFSAFALATGIANAQAIRATTFDSGATPSNGGTPPTTGASASSFTQQSNQTTETNLTGLNLPNPTTTKVVVLESDITKIQNRVRVQEATSSY